MLDFLKKLFESVKGAPKKIFKGKIVDNKAAKNELEDLKK